VSAITISPFFTLSIAAGVNSSHALGSLTVGTPGGGAAEITLTIKTKVASNTPKAKRILEILL
jgi:hypothetical protein